MMLEVFDISRKRVAVMQNAFDITETIKLNGVSSLSFSIPATDEKADYCTARRFVRYSGDMYRIIDYTVDKEDTSVITFECEHAIATLVDRLLFQEHILTGYTTREAIEYILDCQSDWVLDVCEFDFLYDYAWTSENLLAALWSIATPFTDYYRWTFDTSSYPWRLSLRKIDLLEKPEFYVFQGLNFLRSQKKTLSSEAVTRLYCLGYGEGVNQLGIESIDGLAYIEAEPEYITEHGLIEAVFCDRSYQSADALYAAGLAILNEKKNPRVEYSVEVADLTEITGNDLHMAEVGKIIMFKADNYKTYITEVVKKYDTDEMSLTIANKPSDIAESIADLADRQRIESTYSQGATQLWGSVLQNNASSTEAIVYPLWIPDETVIVNKIMLKVKLSKFRAYSKTTSSGGGSSGSTQTSSAGGGRRVSSESGGSSTSTSGQTGGGSSSTSASYGAGYHQHIAYLPYHHHPVYIPNHTHEVSIPAHTHKVDVPGVASHTHNIDYGIYFSSETPTGATVTIRGDSFNITTDYEGDITAHLIGEDGTIPRGQFIDISIKPNTLAFAHVAVSAQGFIQSRGGGKY